jgi:hypothetical protein
MDDDAQLEMLHRAHAGAERVVFAVRDGADAHRPPYGEGTQETTYRDQD